MKKKSKLKKLFSITGKKPEMKLNAFSPTKPEFPLSINQNELL